ncbi:MAG: ABC transporter permease subunit [Rubripirellula sp.]
MPVHDLGYRGWQGERTKRLFRPFFVARSGISLVWRRRWIRMMLMLAWLPIIVPAAGIFSFEYAASKPGAQRVVIQMLRGPLQRPDLALQAMTDPSEARHEIWSTLILAFFRVPQLTAMVLLIGLIAPMLVSYDLRSKAYLLYFSRPLSPAEYIVGKSAVVWAFLFMIVTVPALMLYVIGVLLSPDLSVVSETWDIPARIIAASVVLVVPTTALAICYSSCTSESRYASFAWFATWVMGYVAYQVLTNMSAMNGGRRPTLEPTDVDRWRLLSPYHTLGKVESWVFGLDVSDGSVWPAMLLLAVITVVGTIVVRRRIIARLSV